MSNVIEMRRWSKKEGSQAESDRYRRIDYYAYLLQDVFRQIEIIESEWPEESKTVQRSSGIACTLEIRPGEFGGREGFYGYYRNGDHLFCVRFCRNIYRSKLKSWAQGRDIRIPWKRITSGEKFIADVTLDDVFRARIGTGYINDCLYLEDAFKEECFAAADLEEAERIASRDL